MPKSRPDLADEITDEVNILSFIVRVWREDLASEKRQAIWRGHVTPIPNGKRHYFKNIGEIPSLIVAHLKLQK